MRNLTARSAEQQASETAELLQQKQLDFHSVALLCVAHLQPAYKHLTIHSLMQWVCFTDMHIHYVKTGCACCASKHLKACYTIMAVQRASGNDLVTTV